MASPREGNASLASPLRRVDRPGGTMGFFDNMMALPIMTQGDWQYFEIDGFVHAEAGKIALGLLVYGGKARFDDASLHSAKPRAP